MATIGHRLTRTGKGVPFLVTLLSKSGDEQICSRVAYLAQLLYDQCRTRKNKPYFTAPVRTATTPLIQQHEYTYPPQYTTCRLSRTTTIGIGPSIAPT